MSSRIAGWPLTAGASGTPARPSGPRPIRPSSSATCARRSACPSARAGCAAAAKSLVRRENREIQAVDGISFDIDPGEVVGFLGPNGAGKTTTLKMLSGLLYPTSGEATVLGYVPSRREAPFLRRITMVMGNRNQLQWDLPALDSFELNRAIYRLDPPTSAGPATSSSSCWTSASSSTSPSATCRSASG